MALGAAGDFLTGCEVDWGGLAKDCGLECLWDMLPIPNPCGKFLSAAAGAIGGFNSFPAETPVQVRPAGATANAAQVGQAELKPIGELKPGDEVLAWSEWKEPGSDPQADARLSYEKVQQVITSTREQHLVHLTLDSGETITATAGHPFRTREGWRDAVLLKKGGQLLLKGEAGDDSSRWATVAEVRKETRTVQVFNLEVANVHTFFVGEKGYLAHNGRGATGKAREDIWKACGGKCTYCGCQLQKNACASNSFECDHYYPVALGGDPGPDNQVGAYRTCNRRWGKNWPGRGIKPTLPGR
jgi:hypothetical protein